jgi:hypothetical protein
MFSSRCKFFSKVVSLLIVAWGFTLTAAVTVPAHTQPTIAQVSSTPLDSNTVRPKGLTTTPPGTMVSTPGQFNSQQLLISAIIALTSALLFFFRMYVKDCIRCKKFQVQFFLFLAELRNQTPEQTKAHAENLYTKYMNSGHTDEDLIP